MLEVAGGMDERDLLGLSRKQMKMATVITITEKHPSTPIHKFTLSLDIDSSISPGS